MSNGEKINTVIHPVEMLIPMLHFRDVRFDFDIVTANGVKVVLEMQAFPESDENVTSLHESVKSMMENPKTLSDIKSIDKYSAIFIPSGHGSVINLPTNAALGRLLPTVTLCHGPAALLSTKEGGKNQFAYSGCETMCFTDKTDAMKPSFGYLPGDMPWKAQETIEKEGIKVVNTTESGATKQDRELITGDSPTAAHNLGIFAAPTLVNHAVENE